MSKKHWLQATYKMVEYNRIDISGGIDVNKTSESKRNVIFVTIGILKISVLSMNHIFVMVIMI